MTTEYQENHTMRYTLYRGLAEITNSVRLKFATINLKKPAKWKWDIKGDTPLFYRKIPALLNAKQGFSTV